MIKLFIQILTLTVFMLSSSFAELPVPRWVSLKGDAHLRKGPTEDATIVYR